MRPSGIDVVVRYSIFHSDKSATLDDYGGLYSRQGSHVELLHQVSHSFIRIFPFFSRRRKFCRLQRGRHDCDRMDIDDVDLSFVRNMIDKVDDHTEIKFILLVSHLVDYSVRKI